MHNQQQDQYTFVIRLWHEKSNGQFVWRGSLTNVKSGMKKYFQSVTDLTELLAEMVGSNLKHEGGASQKTENADDSTSSI